jgi:adenylate cyclase
LGLICPTFSSIVLLNAGIVADVAGYGRLAGADEERTLARLRELRSDLIDPAVAVHHGHVVGAEATR